MQLHEDILIAVRKVDASDFVLLLPLLMGGNGAVQKAVLQTVVSFVTNEMRLSIID
jgi:protein MPAN